MEFLTAIVSLIIGILFIVYGCFFDKWWAPEGAPAAESAAAKDVKADDRSSKY